MELFGQYDFKNYTEINFSKYKESGDKLNGVMLHENIHFLLSTSTRWGIFRYCLEKPNTIDNKLAYLNQFLSFYSRQVQEATSNFIEILYLAETNNYSNVEALIDELKYGNKKYYDYMYVLLPFLQYIENLYKNKVDFKKINSVANCFISLIYSIAKHSLNTNIYNVDIEYIKTKKILEKLVTNSKLSNELLPFRRFKYYSREAIKHLNSYEEIGINGIINSIKMCEDELKQEELEIVKSVIMALYDNSKKKDIINEYLCTVNFKYISSEDAMTYSLPNSFTENYDVELGNELPKTISKNKVIYYFGGQKDIQDLLINKVMDKETLNYISNLTRNKLVYIFDIYKKKILMYDCKKADILNLMYKINTQPIVVSYKCFDFKSNEIKSLGGININKTIYIHCDRAYAYVKEIINSFCIAKAKAGIIQFNGMGVLVIKLSKNKMFFLPFIMSIYDRILQDITNDNFDIKIEIDNRIMKKRLINDMNLIINNIFLL